MKLLLHSGGHFVRARDDVLAFLGDVRRLLFVPYALDDLDGYVDMVRERCQPWGLEVEGIHDAADPREALASADALFMGGGNTFRLLTRLIDLDLIEPIRRRVGEGMLYLGSSAGSNVACPTIMTTNDMPIVHPPSFDALGLVPFQINPHYQDPDPDSEHQGESRETRLREYHEMNDLPVVGLREGSLLVRDGDRLELKGFVGARLFRRGEEPTEHVPGDRLDQLLEPAAAV